MEVNRIQIILQLLSQVLYQKEDITRPPLILVGVKNMQHQVKIAEAVFALGVSISVLREDYHGIDRILKIIGKDFHSKILIDFELLKDKSIFQQLANRKLLSTKREYLIIGRSLEEFKDVIKKVSVYINAKLKFAEINAKNVLIHAINNPAQPFGGRFSYHLDKEFKIDNGHLTLSKDYSIDTITVDWTSVTLPVGMVSLQCDSSSVVSDEFVDWYEAEVDGSSDASPRLGFSLFRAFQQIIGFNITIVCAQYWSITSDTGGAVGDLSNGLTVISTAPMFALETRRRILEIIHPLGDFKTMFTFQTPKEEDLSGSAFYKPFSLTLWLCLITAILIVGTVMRKTIQMEIRTNPDKEGYRFIPSFSLTILATLGVVCQQGVSLALKWNTTRILQVAFVICAFVLYNYYTSLVVSSLITFPKYTRINSLKALKDSSLKLGAQNISYFNYYMKESDSKVVQELYKKINQSDEIYFTPEEGIAKARYPGFAYHCESRVNLREMTRTYDLFQLCNYHEVTLIKEPLYAYCTKHSPLTEFFKIQYMRTLEFGIASKKENIFGEPKVTCLSNALIEQVDLNYIAPALLFLVYAMVLCLVILGFEIVWDRVEKRNRVSVG